MGGMMGGACTTQNLKKLSPDEKVQSIHYCADTYKVTTESGIERDFWERNLRFKIDSSQDDSTKGASAILGAGDDGRPCVRHLLSSRRAQPLRRSEMLIGIIGQSQRTEAVNQLTKESTITCPHCGHRSVELMLVDAC